jgi:hypothetical protein
VHQRVSASIGAGSLASAASLALAEAASGQLLYPMSEVDEGRHPPFTIGLAAWATATAEELTGCSAMTTRANRGAQLAGQRQPAVQQIVRRRRCSLTPTATRPSLRNFMIADTRAAGSGRAGCRLDESPERGFPGECAPPIGVARLDDRRRDNVLPGHLQAVVAVVDVAAAKRSGRNAVPLTASSMLVQCLGHSTSVHPCAHG